MLKRLTINLDSNIVDKLDEYAKERYISRTSAITIILSDYFSGRAIMNDLNKIMNLAEEKKLEKFIEKTKDKK
jgi:metal-responsive CopG/Arc/MetJ family transcriptional regulator